MTAWIDDIALGVASRFTLAAQGQKRAELQCAVIEAMRLVSNDVSDELEDLRKAVRILRKALRVAQGHAPCDLYAAALRDTAG